MENNNTNNFYKSFSEKILSSSENEYVIIRVICYIIIILSISYYAITSSVQVWLDQMNKWIEIVQSTDSIIEWYWDYKGLKAQYQQLKNYNSQLETSLRQKEKSLLEKIDSALPDELNTEIIAKFFEDLFLSLSTRWNLVVLNSVNIGKPYDESLKVEWKSVNYKKYPVTLALTASRSKLDQVIDLIEVSWVLDQKYYFKGQALPVMSISSIEIDFSRKNKPDEVKNQSLQLFMYSYSEKQVDSKTNKSKK